MTSCSLGDKTLPKWGLLLMGRICSCCRSKFFPFKVDFVSVGKGDKNENDRVSSPARVSMHSSDFKTPY